jgi:hypothetical protein
LLSTWRPHRKSADILAHFLPLSEPSALYLFCAITMLYPVLVYISGCTRNVTWRTFPTSEINYLESLWSLPAFQTLSSINYGSCKE